MVQDSDAHDAIVGRPGIILAKRRRDEPKHKGSDRIQTEIWRNARSSLRRAVTGSWPSVSDWKETRYC